MKKTNSHKHNVTSAMKQTLAEKIIKALKAGDYLRIVESGEVDVVGYVLAEHYAEQAKDLEGAAIKQLEAKYGKINLDNREGMINSGLFKGIITEMTQFAAEMGAGKSEWISVVDFKSDHEQTLYGMEWNGCYELSPIYAVTYTPQTDKTLAFESVETGQTVRLTHVHKLPSSPNGKCKTSF